jgi:hypothetical protein
MEKRKLILGTYDTALYDWTLAALALTDPDYQSKFQEVPGRDGPLDMSTALSDGEPRYGSRTLTATLELSEGTRMERHARIGKMINALDGRRMDIRHPDYPGHYLTGRVQVKMQYNDLAHAAVTVSAVCDPWLYSRTERTYTLTAATQAKTQALTNRGRRVLVPQVIVTGTDASFLIECGTISLALGPGTYLLPDLLLQPGNTLVRYSGTGTAQISYREAVLR